MRTRPWPPAVSERRVGVALIGGSGFYELADDVEMVTVETPYGDPSDQVAIARFGGRTVAFLPRHGREHTIPAHRVNYRANMWALHSLGAEAVIAPCSTGSLSAEVAPGHLVVLDNMIDRTRGRSDTYFDGDDGVVNHVTFAHPYDDELRRLAIDACRTEGVTVWERGTVAVVNGPRFSTLAESRWFASIGATVVNMTQYPEAVLAAELRTPYVGIALVTDYDAGVEGVHERPVTMDDVLTVMRENVATFRNVAARLVAAANP